MFAPNPPLVFLSFLRPAGKEARCGSFSPDLRSKPERKILGEKQSPTSAGKNFLLRGRRDGKIVCWVISLYSRAPGRGGEGEATPCVLACLVERACRRANSLAMNVSVGGKKKG